mmetsp:Transcript_132103/g.228996  ORF Transcript_132103/g.228996 Transcript_132103/m.228996 type:complete len:636 (-) Transcript_132103:137-2044(-)
MGYPKKEGTEQDMKDSQQLRMDAQQLLSDGKLDDALATITKAIITNPTSGMLYAIRADMCLRQGHIMTCIRDCNEAIGMKATSARVYRVRGKAKMKLCKWEEAVLDLAQANQIDYDDDIYCTIKDLQANKVPQAIARRKQKEQQSQIGITEAKATHCLHMLMYTLHCISQGGICDHLGGGFSRYSVDEFWHVPHFEKMLYDQAQLAYAFSLAYQVDKRKPFENCIRETLGYVQREMTHPDGGFFSAQDADSIDPATGRIAEGAFYTWTFEEVKQMVSGVHPKVLDLFMPSFGIKPGGNVPPDAQQHSDMQKKNVLFLERTTEGISADTGVPIETITEIAYKCKALMFEQREKRPKPALDDKVITCWNGLMISAFAKAGQALQDDSYIVMARKALTFVRQKLYSEQKQELCRSWRNGLAPVDAYHSDYAYFIQGLLDTYTSVGNVAMLRWAENLQTKAEELFADPTGAYYDSRPDPHLLVRNKEDHDGAEPSANSIAICNLWRMGHMLQKPKYLQRGKMALIAMKKQMMSTPRSCSQLITALDIYSQAGLEIVVVGDPASPETKALLAPLHAILLMRKVITFYSPTEPIFKEAPYLQGLTAQDGSPTVYVFEDWERKGSAKTAAELEAILVSLHVA